MIAPIIYKSEDYLGTEVIMTEVSNREVGDKLTLIGELLEITDDNPFKIRAFYKAAETVDRMPGNVSGMGEEELVAIPGIGKAIAKKVRDIVETGTCNELEELKARIPASLIELLKIEGVGPKTIATLWKKMNIQSIDDLEKAARGRRIRAVKGFGEKKEAGFLEAIALYRSAGGRMTRLEAEAVVDKVTSVMTPGTWEVAGSYRRGKSTVGDIDIVSREFPSRLNPRLRTVADEVIDEGERRTSVRVLGQRVDIRFSREQQFGSMLIYLTGSKDFNIRLREIAIEKGLKINEYGIEDRTAANFHEFATEQEMFRFLGLDYITPELRENQGEIERAAEGRLPDLVVQKDIRGDLHVHTNRSDGFLTLDELAEKGARIGYEYLLCSDHSATLGITHGLDEINLAKQVHEIEIVNRKGLGCTLLQGIEVDILSNGTLGLPNQALADLDLVLASVHSGLKEDRDSMTRRVMAAMENENVDIIGHPTGRLIGKRQPFEIDIPRIIDLAVTAGTALESNASPWRLDLDDTSVKQAVDKGVRIAIGTDTHHAEDFSFMRYGITIVRRGWCRPPDLLNTRTMKELLEWAS